MKNSDAREINGILRHLPGWEELKGPRDTTAYGKTAVVCFYGEVQVQQPILEQKSYKLQKIRSIKNYKATKATKYKLLCRGRKSLINTGLLQ